MSLLKIILFISMLPLVSCINLPKKSMPVPQKITPLQCEKIEAKVGLTPWPFELENIKRYSAEDPNGYYYDDAKILTAELQKQIPLTVLSKDSVGKSLTLGFSANSKTHNYGWIWLSALSYGLVPIILDAETTIELRIYDENGTFIKEYMSSKVESNVYAGIWFLPLAFSQRWRVAKELQSDRIAFAINELIQQAAQDKVFNCR